MSGVRRRGGAAVGSVPGRRPARAYRRDLGHEAVVPRRVWVGPTRVLMYCRDCKTPWAPNVEIPHDRLCAQCLEQRELDTPGLWRLDELSGGGDV
ncbi:hypothetical protein ACPESR_25455 [Nocardia testacea]|uniref:hypothetical protein n=1 Tax=Nocardia testacea TaxID=248551 RepID=UPI003C2F20E0